MMPSGAQHGARLERAATQVGTQGRNVDLAKGHPSKEPPRRQTLGSSLSQEGAGVCSFIHSLASLPPTRLCPAVCGSCGQPNPLGMHGPGGGETGTWLRPWVRVSIEPQAGSWVGNEDIGLGLGG